MSTKTVLREYVTDITGCGDCKHRDDKNIFQLCKHEQSQYRYDGKADYHTIQHMREQRSPCGLDKKLFQGA